MGRRDGELPAGVTFVACDLADTGSVKAAVDEARPDYVVHLAGVAFVAHGHAADIYRSNITGTVNLLEALLPGAASIKKILLAGTGNVYGNALPGGGTLDESVVPSPENHYGVSKLAMEYAARLYFQRLPIVITRPFNYTGVGQEQKFLIPKIVAHYAERNPVLELGNLDVERDFSDVRDVVRVYRKILESDASGEIVNVCSGIGTTLQSVLDIASEITGHRPEIRVNLDFVRANEIKRLVGSNARLSSLIGDAPDTPIRDTIDWMLRG